jgi:hypothetical protein
MTLGGPNHVLCASNAKDRTLAAGTCSRTVNSARGCQLLHPCCYGDQLPGYIRRPVALQIVKYSPKRNLPVSPVGVRLDLNVKPIVMKTCEYNEARECESMRRVATSLVIVLVALTLLPLLDPGWRLLSGQFPAARPGANVRAGETIHIYTPKTVVPMGYRNVMRVGADETGIYARVGPPFGVFLKPVHIPWSEIAAYEIARWPDREDTEIWLPRIRTAVSFRESAMLIRSELDQRKVPRVAPQTLERWRGMHGHD